MEIFELEKTSPFVGMAYFEFVRELPWGARRIAWIEEEGTKLDFVDMDPNVQLGKLLLELFFILWFNVRSSVKSF